MLQAGQRVLRMPESAVVPRGLIEAGRDRDGSSEPTLSHRLSLAAVGGTSPGLWFGAHEHTPAANDAVRAARTW